MDKPVILLQYLRKGTKVLVSGEPKPESYTDKQGKLVNYINCNAEKIELLSKQEKRGLRACDWCKGRKRGR